MCWRIHATTLEQQKKICAECSRRDTTCKADLQWYEIVWVVRDSHGWNKSVRTVHKQWKTCSQAVQYVANLNRARGYKDIDIMENGEVFAPALCAGSKHVVWYGPYEVSQKKT